MLDVLVQKRRNKGAALKLLRKLLKNQGVHPEAIVTDGLASYRAALRELGCKERHRPGRLRDNNRVENSHLVTDDGSENSSGSRARAPPRDSYPPTQPSMTPSTPNPT